MKFTRFLFRHFHKKIFLLLIVSSLLVCCSSSETKYLVFIGTYTGNGSDGIYSLQFDPSDGKTTSAVLAVKTDNPSFIAISKDGNFLYAVNELNNFGKDSTGAVSVFEIDKNSGKLKLLQQISSLGADPAHLSIDKTGKYLLVANYTGGNIAVFPIMNYGKLGEHTSLITNVGSSINKERQNSPHPHFIQTTDDNKFVLVADLAIDKILIFHFDESDGSLKPNDQPFIELASGSGPRQFVISPSGKFIYGLNELASTITIFDFELSTAHLNTRQTISTLPENFSGQNTAAGIVMDKVRKNLYASNRGDDSIVQFNINSENGKLSTVGWISSGGKTPRNFEIDPTGQWIFSANQNSNDILLLKVDSDSGKLKSTEKIIEVGNPVCVRFLSLK